MASSESRTLYAKYQDASGERIGGKEVTTSDVTFSSGNASITLDARANSAEIGLTNNGTTVAILTTLKLKGNKITDFGNLEAKVIDGASIIDYGRRTMKLNLPAVDNFNDAENIAYFELHRRSQPRGAMETITLKSHGTRGGGHHANQLQLTLGDRIAIQESQTEHSASYYITGEAHRLSEGGQLLETTWYLEPAPSTYPWKLGVEGRSNLGLSTRITY